MYGLNGQFAPKMMDWRVNEHILLKDVRGHFLRLFRSNHPNSFLESGNGTVGVSLSLSLSLSLSSLVSRLSSFGVYRCRAVMEPTRFPVETQREGDGGPTRPDARASRPAARLTVRPNARTPARAA